MDPPESRGAPQQQEVAVVAAAKAAIAGGTQDQVVVAAKSAWQHPPATPARAVDATRGGDPRFDAAHERLARLIRQIQEEAADTQGAALISAAARYAWLTTPEASVPVIDVTPSGDPRFDAARERWGPWIRQNFGGTPQQQKAAIVTAAKAAIAGGTQDEVVAAAKSAWQHPPVTPARAVDIVPSGDPRIDAAQEQGGPWIRQNLGGTPQQQEAAVVAAAKAAIAWANVPASARYRAAKHDYHAQTPNARPSSQSAAAPLAARPAPADPNARSKMFRDDIKRIIDRFRKPKN